MDLKQKLEESHKEEEGGEIDEKDERSKIFSELQATIV